VLPVSLCPCPGVSGLLVLGLMLPVLAQPGSTWGHTCLQTAPRWSSAWPSSCKMCSPHSCPWAKVCWVQQLSRLVPCSQPVLGALLAGGDARRAMVFFSPCVAVCLSPEGFRSPALQLPSFPLLPVGTLCLCHAWGVTVSCEGARDCPTVPEQALGSPASLLAETCPGSEVSWWFFVCFVLLVCLPGGGRGGGR